VTFSQTIDIYNFALFSPKEQFILDSYYGIFITCHVKF